MKRYPLQTLLKLREHRVEDARKQLLRQREEVQRRRDTCSAIEAEIAGFDADRAGQRRRLLDPPPPGLAWPQALEAREAHIALLGQQADAARQRLTQARDALREAEIALDAVRRAYFRARARLDALETRKGLWRASERRDAFRREELAVADLIDTRAHGARSA